MTRFFVTLRGSPTMFYALSRALDVPVAILRLPCGVR